MGVWILSQVFNRLIRSHWGSLSAILIRSHICRRNILTKWATEVFFVNAWFAVCFLLCWRSPVSVAICSGNEEMQYRFYSIILISSFLSILRFYSYSLQVEKSCMQRVTEKHTMQCGCSLAKIENKYPTDGNDLNIRWELLVTVSS